MSAVLIIAVAGLILGLIFFFAGARSSASLPTSPIRWQAACVECDYIAGKSQSLITTVFNQKGYE